MSNFRNPTLCERIEDIIIDLQTPIISQVANGAHQGKDGYRFITDNTGEVSPFDWYDSRFLVDYKLVKLADGSNIAVDDHNGLVNSVHSLIKRIDVKVNGIPVYDNAEANQTVNIKNLLEYDQSYVNTASNYFYYLDNNRNAEERPAQAAYNRGFAARKAILGTNTVQIPSVMKYPWTDMVFSKFSKINFYPIRRLRYR